MVGDPVRIGGDGFLHIALCLCPARRVEDLSDEEVPGDHSGETIEAHDLGVPHPQYVQAACVLRIDLQTFERLIADGGSVLHATARALSERCSTECTSEAEMHFRIISVCFNGTSRILLAALEVFVPL